MSPETYRAYVKAYCRAIAASGRPILVGPWRSEVGFETLYWLPFLRWFKSYTGIKAEQMVAVTRGGAGVLYPHMRTVDLYQLRSVEAVRLENAYDRQANGMQKQTQGITRWDRSVLREAADQVLGRDAKFHVLHPSMMYRALAPWWDEQRGTAFLSSMTEFQPLIRPTYHALQLPPQFVAMKWYTRSTFPPTEDVKAFAAEVTTTVAGQMPVVLLSTPHGGDEHTDIIVQGNNIATLPPVPAHESVHLQAAILARASAFVGTYGGVAQMALRMGVPSASFYKDWGGTAMAHRTLSHWLAVKTKVNFQVGDFSDKTLWQRVTQGPAGAAQ